MTTTERGASARLFFALWPPPAVQRTLGRLARELQRECGGRAVPAERCHVTLAFLGETPRGRIAALQAAAAGIAAAPFSLRVDRTGYWRHNRIVWAGVDRCPDALQQLEGALGRRLVAEGYRREGRPYVPHFTLVRNARRPPRVPAIEPLDWPVADFALIESVPRGAGRDYEIVMSWPLPS